MRHMKQKPIAVLFGGRSPEYEVSLASAAGVLEHMDRREKHRPRSKAAGSALHTFP